jgi:hypothetical protein
MDKKKLVISFSGGRTSAYMMWWLLNEWEDRGNWDIVVVFANTGKEVENTLFFVDECSQEWGVPIVWVEAKCIDENGIPYSDKGWSVRHKIVAYETASRNGEPFEEMISILGIPSTNAPFCSPQLKREPIKDYIKSIGWEDYYIAIGVRFDEESRINKNKDKLKIMYPFADMFPTTKRQVMEWWGKQSFDLNIHPDEGNCDYCYKKGLRKLMTLVKDKPELAVWWREMEQKYGEYTPESRIHNAKPPYRFYRDFMSIDDIIEESKFPFEPSKDESTRIDKFKQMLIWDDYLDSNGGCTESCEIF